MEFGPSILNTIFSTFSIQIFYSYDPVKQENKILCQYLIVLSSWSLCRNQM